MIHIISILMLLAPGLVTGANSYQSPCSSGYWHVVGATKNTNKSRKKCDLIINVRNSKTGKRTNQCHAFPSSKLGSILKGVKKNAKYGICLRPNGSFFGATAASRSTKSGAKPKNPK